MSLLRPTAYLLQHAPIRRSALNESVAEQIRKGIRRYERGIYTKLELVGLIAELALDPEFFHHLDLLPRDVLSQLREIAERAPAHPEDCLFIHAGSYGANFDYEAFDRKQRERGYWSARRLREHFYPNLPMPQFEPLKLAGVVHEAIKVEGSIVIFGDIHTSPIRKHPIHLITPDGCEIITSATATGFVKQDCDLESPDRTTQRYGRHGVHLDENVRSPSDIPRGTEVWIDRTAAAEIPPPPDPTK